MTVVTNQEMFRPLDISEHTRFCDCLSEDCRCGEENDAVFEWEWDKNNAASAIVVSEDNLTVQFHNGVSFGTSAIRGTKLLKKGRHHYWEVKLLTPTYGTDLMIGVGTAKVNLNAFNNKFCSFLGHDQESFGFSYLGYIQYCGRKKKYGSTFGQGSLVGVHLNTWKGTLEFFLNRKPLGIAFTGLRNTMLYPMMCSTAADTKVRLSYCSSAPASLQLECISKLKSSQRDYLLNMFPGLHHLFDSIFAKILKKEINDDDDDDYDDDDDLRFLDEYDFALVC
ncbi:SPRY domain-containing SOCS box protein 3 isoform X3 [Augochlora pura]